MWGLQNRDIVMQLATAFRIACETAPHLRHPNFKRFPKGACGEASVLLGQFLRDHECGEWTYHWRVRPDPFQSHAWIVKDGLLVDITADQFDEIDQPVIVSRRSTWHEHFTSAGGTHVAGLEWYDTNHFRDAIHSDYKTLRRLAETT